MVDWGNARSTNLGTAISAKFHNITATSATGTTSSRIVNLMIQARAAYVEQNNNDTLCLANANACQNMVCYGVPSCKMHNNRTQTQLGQQGTSVSSETGRNFLCDGDTGTGMNGCEIYNNYINANDGRAARFRNVNSNINVTSIHDNLIDNIVSGSTGNYAAAIHLCDPDSGNNDASSWDVLNNTLNFKTGAGNGVMARACAGFPKFRNNTLHCTGSCGGMLGDVRQSGSLASTLELINNDPVPLISNPQANAETYTTLRVCKSGSAGGAGLITSVSCP